VQREILDLLDGLRKTRHTAMLFVTHNLGLLSERTDRLAIMYAGEIVEMGPTEKVLAEPRHPYTQGLLASLPRLSGTKGRLPGAASRLPGMAGQPPDPRRLPSGCAFHPRCPKAFFACREKSPALEPSEGGGVACHLYAAVGKS
jgi:peptide/nickel transport system ATP-binding protein